MKLTIITINFNNATGLQKTMQSVFDQTSTDFEYIVVDGGSSDGSYELISQYANKRIDVPFRWVSEKDNGIYHAMNKGIRLAKGEYCQFLNSGDIMVDCDTTLCMLSQISGADIVYGNMLKPMSMGMYRDPGFEGRIPTFRDMYMGTLNHSPSYIKKSLFDKFGLYDESLKIVSDWKWFLNIIIFQNIIPYYQNIDVSVFDMTGISNTNKNLEILERRKVLDEILPKAVLQDYELYFKDIDSLLRIKDNNFSQLIFRFIDGLLARKKRRKHFI